MVERCGGRAARAGLFNGCDLLRAEGRAKIRSLIKELRPRWVWVSMPCGATSTAQFLNELNPEAWAKSQARKRRSRRLVRYMIEILEDFVTEGGLVAWEWPRHNQAWRFPEVGSFWAKRSGEEILLDGCQFNLRNEAGELSSRNHGGSCPRWPESSLDLGEGAPGSTCMPRH